MRRRMRFSIALSAALAGVLSVCAVWAQTKEEKERAELTQALPGAKVSLEQGLSASQREGKPISGKFEVENGKLQLSVYTMKAGKFSEVIVDHTTGKIVKAEPITGGDNLTAAQAQSEAMAKAKLSLHAATLKAVRADKGFRAVSVVPSLKDAHPVAEITLVKGSAFKTVTEKLD
jgi:hypothetical protein